MTGLEVHGPTAASGAADPDAHLLVVDDDERIRTLLRQATSMRQGFLVSRWRATRRTHAACSRGSTSTSW